MPSSYGEHDPQGDSSEHGRERSRQRSQRQQQSQRPRRRVVGRAESSSSGGSREHRQQQQQYAPPPPTSQQRQQQQQQHQQQQEQIQKQQHQQQKQHHAQQQHYPQQQKQQPPQKPMTQQQKQQQPQKPMTPSVPPSSSSNPTPVGVPSAPPPPRQQQVISVESPLPPVVQRCLGDRSYDKRKSAALEIEALVKSLQEAHNTAMIQSVFAVLSKDFCTSMNANYRKGGLIGIAAGAIGLMHNTKHYLDALLPPVLHCFDDPESRVRYYACESLYNIAKVARTSILQYFNQIFDGLTRLFADVDVDVKNGANLLDRLIKDIVTESETFHVEQFLPLLQNYIRRTNPYIRQLLVGWITVLDSVPDISMIDYLPDFLDGLFNMLSDSNREIRQAADSALSEFLREVRLSTVVEFGPMVSILVLQCHNKERLNRLTAITWLAELIHHPHSGGDALLPYHAEVLKAIMRCISDGEGEIRKVAERTNDDLLSLVRDTEGGFELSPLLDTLTGELLGKDDVPTKMAALRWVNMLLEKRKGDMNAYIPNLLPVLLQTLSDPSDAVVLLNLQVLSRISLAHKEEQKGGGKERKKENNTKEKDGDNAQSKMVLDAILGLFASDRQLLETRGSLIVRKLCVLLNAKSVYIQMADTLSSYEASASLTVGEGSGHGGSNKKSNDSMVGGDTSVFTLEFIGTMVQTLNLILLTAAELHGLRVILAESFIPMDETMGNNMSGPKPSKQDGGTLVFASLFRCWCHCPVATFSLCLLARAYDVAFALVKRFSELDVTVSFLMQIDKLVQLLESPIFVHLRLQLLDIGSPHHACLLKSCYGLLMLLPQSDAFRSLNDRLATVCNLRDNLGISPNLTADKSVEIDKTKWGSLDPEALLTRFDEVMELHRKSREMAQRQAMQQGENLGINGTLMPQQGGGYPHHGGGGGNGTMVGNGAWLGGGHGPQHGGGSSAPYPGYGNMVGSGTGGGAAAYPGMMMEPSMGAMGGPVQSGPRPGGVGVGQGSSADMRATRNGRV